MGEEPIEARLPRLMALVWPLPLSHAVGSWGTWTPTGLKGVPVVSPLTEGAETILGRV